MTLKGRIDYHKKNPQIYEMYKKFAFQAINSKRPYYSSEMIINRVRWETMTKAHSGFKISNEMKAFYSRLFVLQNPTYKNFFKFKPSICDGLKLKMIK
jgi:hypothetical protein